jgi:hypothetical protein
MTRLARHCVNAVGLLVVSLSLGAGSWAQGRPAPTSKPAQKERPESAAKAPARRAAKRAIAVASAPAKPSSTGEAPAAAPAATEKDTALDLVGKRDPFVALINTAKGGPEHLPPGKAGLVIGTLTVQGTVQGANGMIAVIANPDQRVYFVREGDRLYDGEVEKISLDGVTFQQNTKDAFGKPIERTVVKRIYPSAGEQQ